MVLARLTLSDALVFATYLLVLAGIWWAVRRGDARAPGERSGGGWVAALAMASTGIGAVEALAMGAMGAKYGMASLQLTWLGTIPALLVLSRVVVPVYVASGARSLPHYLQLRFDARSARVASALTTAMRVVMAGIALYAVGTVLQVVLGWRFGLGVGASALVALALAWRVRPAHLRAHEALQLLLLVALVAPVAFLGLRATGGWERLIPVRLVQAAINSQLPQWYYTKPWTGMGDPRTNSLGVEWVGLLLGVGFLLTFAYWCTDALVMARASSAARAAGARRGPLVAGIPRLLLALPLIVPGLTALIMGGGEGGAPYGGMGQGVLVARRTAGGAPLIDTLGRTLLDFDQAVPLMLAALAPPGWLGAGLVSLVTAALAGVVGNLVAIGRPHGADMEGRAAQPAPAPSALALVGTVAASVGVAWAADAFTTVMEFFLLAVAVLQVPLLVALGLGMLWRRGTAAGAFAAALAGVVAAVGHHALAVPYALRPGLTGGYLAPLLLYRTPLALAAWTAIAAGGAALVVGVVVSLRGTPRPHEELGGLVRSLVPASSTPDRSWVRGGTPLAVLLVAGAIALNLYFAR